MQTTRRLLVALALILGLASCAPPHDPVDDEATLIRPLQLVRDEPTFTPEQVRYLAAQAWIEAETRAFLDGIAAVRAAVPARLHRIMWCEAGRYLALPAYTTNYSAKTHGEEGASGGGQALGSTWRTWAAEVGVDIARWPRAYLAPDWVQDLVLTHGYETRGTSPWTASAGCWS